MRILLVNQTFYPDRVATAQYLTDLALAATAAGHSVTVLTSARGYDDPALAFPERECWRGITIVRVRATAWGKTARWRRAADFATYLAASVTKLFRFRRFDAVVALTSPPLVSVLGALFTWAKGGRFIFWVMDLNPDEAIAAGWLKPRSIAARTLEAMLRFSLARADAVVALDRFMAAVLASKGVAAAKIHVLSPWSHADVAPVDERARDSFRQSHGLADAFVIMYAGNHSPCNPLHTLVAAAERLAHVPDLRFCFVGGGSEFRRLRADSEARGHRNVTFIPYQPRDVLARMLAAADLHVVTLGDAFRGLIHPSKIYNVLKIGAPVLYIGPDPSHVTELLDAHPTISAWRSRHGDVDAVSAAILAARGQARRAPSDAAQLYTAAALLPRLLRLLEGSGTAPARGICVTES